MKVFDSKIWNDASGFNYGDLKTSLKNGSYNSGTGVWTDGGTTYSFIRNGNTIIVNGTVPYAAADATLGLTAGNRIAAKFIHDGITAKSELPDGIIAKITNTSVASGYNEYTKDSFETDGSLILVTNCSKNKILEVFVTWESGEVTSYEFNFSGATFATE